MYLRIRTHTSGLALLNLTGGKQAPFSRLQTCLTAQPGRSALAGRKIYYKTLKTQS